MSDKPVFFKLDGKFAAEIPSADGGSTILVSPGADTLADFMERGKVVTFDELSDSFKRSVERINAKAS
jgi:hypothetical protein